MQEALCQCIHLLLHVAMDPVVGGDVTRDGDAWCTVPEVRPVLEPQPVACWSTFQMQHTKIALLSQHASNAFLLTQQARGLTML